MNKYKIIDNIFVFIIILLGFIIIHEFGHILFHSILGDDKFIELSVMDYMVKDKPYLAFVCRFEYNLETPNDLIFGFFGGFGLSFFIGVVLLFFTVKNIFIISCIFFNLIGQSSYMMLSSILETGDMSNIYWYYKYILKVDYNIYFFFSIFLIFIIILTILWLFYIYSVGEKK